MKLKVFFIIVSIVFFASCGTNKNVVKHQKRNEVVIEIEEEKPILPQLEQVKRRVKTKKNQTEAYIEKFAPIAVKKMYEHSIPASITLAQGVLESGSGRSPLAIKSNNHFGIKCHKGWQGKSVTHDDDEKGECFRKYKYPESSYEDHSQFLLTRSRYASLFKLGRTNYKAWAYGLKRAGYATDKKYPQKLISIIKKYDLHKYDKATFKGALKVNKSATTYHEVKKGETLYSLSVKYKTTVKEIKNLNNLKTNTLSIGQKILIK